MFVEWADSSTGEESLIGWRLERKKNISQLKISQVGKLIVCVTKPLRLQSAPY